MNTKLCSKCRIEKDFNLFNKCKQATFGLHRYCRDCQKENKRQWYILNKEKEKKKSREYSKTKKAKEERKIRYQKNKDKILEENRIRRKTPYARNLANKARNKIYKENINFRISVNMRSRIRYALKGISKVKHTIEFLGCDMEFLKSYLESKFTEGMSWNNYGYHGWHIDHIIPCSAFDFTRYEDQIKCFHYTNLQPLWMKDNISKHNKII